MKFGLHLQYCFCLFSFASSPNFGTLYRVGLYFIVSIVGLILHLVLLKLSWSLVGFWIFKFSGILDARNQRC